MAKLLAIVIMISMLVEIECKWKEDMQRRLADRTNRKVCPPGFEYYREANTCYRVLFQPLNWWGAGEACRRLKPGAHLVAVTSAAEQRAIRNYLERQFTRGESSVCQTRFWLGGGKIVWTSGQTKDPNRCGTAYYWKTMIGADIPFTYTNWLAGEPNCLQDNEKCAHIAAGIDYQWNDSTCSIQICALCEY